MTDQRDDVCPDGPACTDRDCRSIRKSKRLAVPEPGPSLYDDVIAAGIQHASHYSDLYLPSTPEVRALLAKHGIKVNGHSASTFTNQVEGGTWIDVPFRFDPYWATRTNR